MSVQNLAIQTVLQILEGLIVCQTNTWNMTKDYHISPKKSAKVFIIRTVTLVFLAVFLFLLMFPVFSFLGCWLVK